MKRTIRIIVPLVLVLAIVLGLAWYLFIYDRAFTRDMLLSAARFFEDRNQSVIAGWFYDRAYDQAEDNDVVAIELAEQYIEDDNYTQAERTLSKAISNRPTAALYAALCKTYVAQNKVRDAVQLLDNIRDTEIIAQLNQIRPAAPVAYPESGSYNQFISVTIEGTGGKLYANPSKEYPSITDDAYSEPIALAGGENVIYAVVISEDGLVSPLSALVYIIGDVVEEVNFQDPAIESEIRTILSVDAEQRIYSDALWSIESFTVPENAASFTDLAYLKFLKELNISGGPSGQLSFLSQIPNLTKLSIKNVDVTADELKIIGALPALENLTLSDCSLSTTAGLETAVNLTSLDLSNNTIRNLSSLSGMKKLKSLNLQRNAVNDLSAISGCVGLVNLDVSYNAVSSVAPISSIASLRTLDAGNNAIASLPSMDALSGLETLSLSHNTLSDISPLAPCKSLKNLDISYNNLSDISSLADKSSIVNLYFTNNSVTAIPSFSKDSALVTIDGSNNKLTSVSPLGGHMNVNNIIVDNNADLSTLDSLSECPVLVKVTASGTAVDRVGALTERGIVVIK